MARSDKLAEMLFLALLTFALASGSALGGRLFQFPVLAFGFNRFGGSLFQPPAFPLGLNAFGGRLSPMLLRMNAKIMPRSLRKIDVVILGSLLDVREGQSTVAIGDADT